MNNFIYEFKSKKDLKQAKKTIKYSESMEEFEWLLHMDNIKYKKQPKSKYSEGIEYVK